MKIQYLSDVHLEFMTKPPKIKVMADVFNITGGTPVSPRQPPFYNHNRWTCSRGQKCFSHL